MNRRLSCILCAVCCYFLMSANVLAQYSDETPIISKTGQVGLFYTQSAKTLGRGRLVVGIYSDFSSDKNFLKSVRNVSDSIVSPYMDIENFYPHIAFGLFRSLDFSVFMPIYLDRLEESSLGTSKVGGLQAGYGDLEMQLKFQYPPYEHPRLFDMAYSGAISLPTGMEKDAFFPRHNYYFLTKNTQANDSTGSDSVGQAGFYTSAKPELDMKMLWTFDLSQLAEASPVLLHVNYGIRFMFNSQLDHVFLLNMAFQYRPAHWFTMFTELSGEAKISNFRIGHDPLRLSPGISITPAGGLYLSLGADISVASDSLLNYGIQQHTITTNIEPRWRLVGAIGWTGSLMPLDKDKDGISDNIDKCPLDPEDKDGFEDADGCPDLDNDGDGIVDVKDKCPNAAEDFDGFQDDDGCPDFDNDLDGVPDSLDKCPNVLEDRDNFQDFDGCPDYDNDQDGIPDTLDKCPSIPEDRDAFQDADGCPDFDNDQDAVPDSVDKCPNVAGVKENNGCPAVAPPPAPEKPKAKEIKRGRLILKGVNFETGLAVLTPESYAILDQVYLSLAEWPEIKIEIKGHTDSIGGKEANRQLSLRRAESVRDYLMGRNIDGSRITAKGMGMDEPIADNKTASGRALNRRVELQRID